MLALSCAPEGRPGVATAAVMLAGLLARRGLAWLGLHVRDGDQHFTLLVAVAAQHTLSFSVSRGMWCRCSWRRGACWLPRRWRRRDGLGRCGGVVRTLANDMIVVIYRQGREASGDVAGQSSRWWG